MTRRQRQRASEEVALQAVIEKYRAKPCRLSPQVVDALLGELCGEFGVCLAPDDFDSVVADPPTDPFAFAELVVTLECGGIEDRTIVDMILGRVVSTFEGAVSWSTV